MTKCLKNILTMKMKLLALSPPTLRHEILKSKLIFFCTAFVIKRTKRLIVNSVVFMVLIFLPCFWGSGQHPVAIFCSKQNQNCKMLLSGPLCKCNTSFGLFSYSDRKLPCEVEFAKLMFRCQIAGVEYCLSNSLHVIKGEIALSLAMDSIE